MKFKYTTQNSTQARKIYRYILFTFITFQSFSVSTVSSNLLTLEYTVNSYTFLLEKSNKGAGRAFV